MVPRRDAGAGRGGAPLRRRSPEGIGRLNARADAHSLRSGHAHSAAAFLPDHQISTAYAEGWSNFQNGDLLAAAEGRFDLFITTDKNLRYQQDLRGRTLAILVLTTTSWPEIQRHGLEVAELVSKFGPGDYREMKW